MYVHIYSIYSIIYLNAYYIYIYIYIYIYDSIYIVYIIYCICKCIHIYPTSIYPYSMTIGYRN